MLQIRQGLVNCCLYGITLPSSGFHLVVQCEQSNYSNSVNSKSKKLNMLEIRNKNYGPWNYSMGHAASVETALKLPQDVIFPPQKPCDLLRISCNLSTNISRPIKTSSLMLF